MSQRSGVGTDSAENRTRLAAFPGHGAELSADDHYNLATLGHSAKYSLSPRNSQLIEIRAQGSQAWRDSNPRPKV